jgi:hypothetical protein
MTPSANCVEELLTELGLAEKFFRLLLEENVQLHGAFFTLEQNESVRINQVLPVDWLQARELAFIVGNVASKADESDDRLRALLK